MAIPHAKPGQVVNVRPLGAALDSAQTSTLVRTADVEVIPIQKVNEAYERLLKSDVKYRFSIDMSSLKSE